MRVPKYIDNERQFKVRTRFNKMSAIEFFRKIENESNNDGFVAHVIILGVPTPGLLGHGYPVYLQKKIKQWFAE